MASSSEEGTAPCATPSPDGSTADVADLTGKMDVDGGDELQGTTEAKVESSAVVQDPNDSKAMEVDEGAQAESTESSDDMKTDELASNELNTNETDSSDEKTHSDLDSDPGTPRTEFLNNSELPEGDQFVLEDRKKQAETLKGEGNGQFKAKNYEAAVDLYTKSIDMFPLGPAYNNRATCQFKLENFGSAILDAGQAIELKFYKGYYRRGCSNAALMRWKKAISDFKKAGKRFPKNADISRNLKVATKALREKQFREAISTDAKPLSEQWEDSAKRPYSVPSSYDGPQLPDDITPEFVNETIKWFSDEKTFPNQYVVEICMRIIKLFQTYPSLVDIDVGQGDDPHITVCGDTHGQYYDLLHIFEMNGLPSPSNPYLFNGDFVDRGSFSAEVILTLFLLKLCYPDSLWMSRGNHETTNMNMMYGFHGEIKAKHTEKIMTLFTECFRWLPLAHVIGKKIFVCHGGLPRNPQIKLQEIASIDRNREPPMEGPMTDLLWADPSPMPGIQPSQRGTSHRFGPDISKMFLKHNDLTLMIRSHEMKQPGYEEAQGHEGRVITIFSAPNYCDTMGNKGAFITIRPPDYKPTYTQFDAQPHPNKKCMHYAQGGLMRMLM